MCSLQVMKSYQSWHEVNLSFHVTQELDWLNKQHDLASCCDSKYLKAKGRFEHRLVNSRQSKHYNSVRSRHGAREHPFYWPEDKAKGWRKSET